jgi:thiamine-monophosphate kinase
MDEFAIIAEILKPLSGGDKNALDFADDIAILPQFNKTTIYTTDTIVEGTHFLINDAPDDIGYKLVMVNVSDIIAKGALPKAGFLNLTLPKNIGADDIKALAKGIAEAKAIYGDFPILGGDTTVTNGNMTLSLSLIGEILGEKPILRNNAQIGDDIYVTGFIGDAKIGLDCLLGKLPSDNYRGCINHYKRPNVQPPRAASLIAKYANAAMDVSDGLLGDLKKMIGDKGAEILLEKIPYSQEADQYAICLKTMFELISFGDDYQILFTASPKNETVLMKSDLKISKIGKIIDKGGLKIFSNGEEIDFARENLSFSHKIGDF